MTLPFLTENVRSTNQIAKAWATTLHNDSIALSVSNGASPKFRIDQIDNVFSMKLSGNKWYVCLIIILVDDKEPKRFIVREEMDTDLINHVNRRKFLGALSYEEAHRFFGECQ